jgi:hypothetical protein
MSNDFYFLSQLDASWNCDGSKGENGVSPIHLNNHTTLTTFGNHHHGHMVHSTHLGQGDNSTSDDRSSPPNHMKNGYLNSSQVVSSSSSHYQSNNVVHQSQTNLTTFSSSTVNNVLSASLSSQQQDNAADRSKAIHSYSLSNGGGKKC